MSPSIAQIINPEAEKPDLVERISFRTISPPITIQEYNSEWPRRFEDVRNRITEALGTTIVLDILHTGSTSVPGLPAKDIIDVDLILIDVLDEASYVKPLEGAGFRFLFREPHWYQHRFFVENWPDSYHVNLHVWRADSPEVTRHRIFRDWLIKTPADLELYAKVKFKAAEETALSGGSMADYTEFKGRTIHEILQRAFFDLGYIE